MDDREEYQCPLTDNVLSFLASHFSNSPETREDLFAEARCEIWRRRDDYDPEKGARMTFFYSVARGAMMHFMRRKSHLIRVPDWLQEQGVKCPDVATLDAPAAGAGDEAEQLLNTIRDPDDLETSAVERLRGEQLREQVLGVKDLTPEQRAALVEVMDTEPKERPHTRHFFTTLQHARRKVRRRMTVSLSGGA